jgi:hypothetical protein
MNSIPIPLDTIRAGYAELGRLVGVALCTQQGDAAKLGEQRQNCLRLLQLTQQVGGFHSMYQTFVQFY